MPAFIYVCPLCHNRLTAAEQSALPPACPACGLDITTQEFTQQRNSADLLRRRARRITWLSWLIALLLVLVFIASMYRLFRM